MAITFCDISKTDIAADDASGKKFEREKNLPAANLRAFFKHPGVVLRELRQAAAKSNKNFRGAVASRPKCN